MPPKKNKPLRIIVPLIGLLIGVGLFVLIIQSGTAQPQTETQTEAQTDTAEADPASTDPETSVADASGQIEAGQAEAVQNGAGPDDAASPAETATATSTTEATSDVTPESSPASTPEPAPGTTYTLRVWPTRHADGSDEPYSPVGSLDPEDPDTFQITISDIAAGIESLALTHEFETVGGTDHIELQAEHVLPSGVTGTPFALYDLHVDSVQVDPTGFGVDGFVWQEQSPGHLRAIVEDADGNPVVQIDRVFDITPGAHDWTLRQTVTNLSDTPRSVRLTQTGPIDMPKAKSSYGGDKRRVRFGYLLNPQAQGTDPTVTADSDLTARRELLGKRDKATGAYPIIDTVWPDTKATENGRRLVWLALTDRYFAVAVHPEVDPEQAAKPEDKLFAQVDRVERIILNPGAEANDVVLLTRLVGTPATIAPGAVQTEHFSLGVYAGPMSKPVVRQDPAAVSLGLDDIIVYNFGGMCAPCTFPFLTHALLGVLRFYESFTLDWAVAIVLLVVTVRTILHPVTRWSQIRMQRFGAQMQGIAPKQQKIREKYKDDPRRVQAETAKLWKEEGINPAGMLGCLPMFLQSPVWIALYATLFFAAELRHEPAFYGVFQSITGGAWHFLADLSAPDSAIPLPGGFDLPLMGHIDAINLLPFLLGAVFFAHQKYLTPPTTATLTPEQQSQQRLIKIMSVFMFPVIMYNAPSGLAIYFITNSSLAIVENKWIRAHMNKHGLLDPEKIKEARKHKASKGGFLARLQQAAEAQRAAREGRDVGYGMGRAGKQKMGQASPRKKVINRQYKKKGK